MRHLTRLSVLLVFGLLLAACPADDPDVTDDDVLDEDLSGDSVEVAAVWTGDEQANFEQVLAEFEEQTGASVSYTSTGDDIAAVVGTRLAGGNPPDVAILPQPGLMVDFAEQGAIQEIEGSVGDLVDEHYAPVWRDLGSHDGTLYGVWVKAANKSTFWYNANVFDDAGVETPSTWAELQSVADTIAAFGVPAFSIAGADGWTLTDWFENVYLRTAGGDLYDQLINHEIPWTDESVVEAMTRLADIFGEEQWIHGGQDGALNTDFPTSVTNVFAAPPNAAMVYEGDFVAGVITGETDAELGVDADFFEFPSIDGSPPSVMGGGDLAVLMTDTDAGTALMRYLASPRAHEIWAELGGFTSPNQGVSLDSYPDDITRRSAEMLVEAEEFRFDMSDLQPAEFGGTPGRGLFQLFQDFLRNPDDIDGVLERMESEASAAFD